MGLVGNGGGKKDDRIWVEGSMVGLKEGKERNKEGPEKGKKRIKKGNKYVALKEG